MSIAQPVQGQRFLLRNLDWSQYRTIADAVGASHVRLAYDRGNLEMMTLSHDHERWSKLIGQFIEVITDELDIPRQSGGSTTFNREDLERGLEPDQCYYLANEPLVRDKTDIDLNVDPPPDLAVEVEISRSAVNRMGIYAAIGVPEVWRFDGEELRVFQLTDAPGYAQADRSRHFPMLPLAEVQRFLRQRGQTDETTLVRSFRNWVREQQARGWK